MSKSRILTAVLLSSMILFVAVAAGAQDGSPATAKLKLKAIKIPSQIDTLHSIQAFIPLSAKKGIAVATSISGDYKYIHTLLVSRNGKATLLDTISEEFEITPYLSAVWIENSSAPGAGAASSGTGLLFYGHEYDDVNCKVSMAVFDGAGKFTGNPVTLIDVTPRGLMRSI